MVVRNFDMGCCAEVRACPALLFSAIRRNCMRQKNADAEQSNYRNNLEPAFAMAIETIDPALAVGRLAGMRQALLFGGARRSGFRGSGIEQKVKGIRRCRRRRETCEKDTSCEARSQMTGHRDPVLRSRSGGRHDGLPPVKVRRF
jgi:hypothetical protein